MISAEKSSYNIKMKFSPSVYHLKIPDGVQNWTQVVNQCVKMQCHHKPFFCHFGSINPNITLEHFHVFGKEKNPLMEKPGHSVYSGSD